MSVKPISGCFTAKQIIQLNDRLNELGFDLGTALDEAFQKVLTAEFALCDASEIPQDTAGVQQFLCITDGVCTFFDKSEIVKLNETVTVLSYNTTTNEISYTNEAGDTVVLALNVSTIAYDPDTNTITHTAGDGTVTTMALPVNSISFDATSCEIVYNDQLGDDTTLDLSSLVSEAPTYDATTGDLTFTSPKDPDTVINIGAPYTPEPNCFYVDGDKTKANAANKVCDAISAGKAIAFTDGAGNVQQLLTGYDEGDVETYIQGQGGTNVDTVNWNWEGGDKIAVCCEEEICGLRPASTTNNTTRVVDTAAGVTTMYRPGFPYELTTTITNLDGSVKTIFGSGAFQGTGIVTTEIPAFTSFEDATISSDEECCAITCEPNCIEWRYLISDIDISSSFTILNPGDVNLVTTRPDDANGSWAQDPLDPNTWIFTQLNPNPSSWIAVTANCDKPIVIQFQTDFVGQQFRQTVEPAALLKYVCDPSVNSNRISAEGPNGVNVNVNTVTIL